MLYCEVDLWVKICPKGKSELFLNLVMNSSQCQKIDGWKADCFVSRKLCKKQCIKYTRHAYGYISYIPNTFSSSSEEGSIARFGNVAAEYSSMKETCIVPTPEKARSSIRLAFK